MIASAKKFAAVPSPTNNTVWTCTPIESSRDADVPSPLCQLYLKNCLFLHRAKHRHANEKRCPTRATSISSSLFKRDNVLWPFFCIIYYLFSPSLLKLSPNDIYFTATLLPVQLRWQAMHGGEGGDIEANKSRSKSGRVVVVVGVGVAYLMSPKCTVNTCSPSVEASRGLVYDQMKTSNMNSLPALKMADGTILLKVTLKSC